MSFICICTIYLCRVHMKCKKTSIAIQLRRLYRLVLVFVNIFVLIICRCVCICKYVWIDICMYLGVYMYLYCKTTVQANAIWVEGWHTLKWDYPVSRWEVSASEFSNFQLEKCLSNGTLLSLHYKRVGLKCHRLFVEDHTNITCNLKQTLSKSQEMLFYCFKIWSFEKELTLWQ